jgi:predicted ferric reductase
VTGRRLWVEGALWIAAYIALTLGPLAVVMLVDTPPGRGFWTEFSAALGFAGLAMLGLQFGITARFGRIAAPYGLDIMLQFHRLISLVAGAVLIGHLVVLFVVRPETIGLLNVLDAPWRARAGVASMLLLIILVAASLWRERLRISYENWRRTHGVLAVTAIALGLGHVIGVGHYLVFGWKLAFWLAITAIAFALLLYIRAIKPFLLLRRPWRVSRVAPQRGDAWSLVLEPVGHDGFSFQPGQFCWLTLGTSPFAIREHPFSISSSARKEGTIELTIKALGDFTSTIRDVPAGTRAYLDGPYGAFTPNRKDAPAYVMIAGGIGITPIMSILRTFADDGDPRHVQLIYSAGSWEEITFRDELEELSHRLDLEVHYVLRDPPDDWAGLTGYVDHDLLRDLVEYDVQHVSFFICGPPPLMSEVERSLEQLGVPLWNIRLERFNLV